MVVVVTHGGCDDTVMVALRGCHLAGTSEGGRLGVSPGLLLTLVTHMSPEWVAQGALDGGTGLARWHLEVVTCLAPVLGWGGLGVPPGLPPVTHVAQDMSPGHRAPCVLPCPR